MELYKIAGEYLGALAAMEANGLQGTVLRDTLEGMSGDFEEKATACVAHALNLDAEAVAIGAAIEKMLIRKKAIEQKSDWIKGYVANHMHGTGINEVKCPEFSAKLARSRGAVFITDESAIPGEFVRVTPETVFAEYKTPDKIAIGKAIADGEKVPGAEVRHTYNLRIT